MSTKSKPLEYLLKSGEYQKILAVADKDTELIISTEKSNETKIHLGIALLSVITDKKIVLLTEGYYKNKPAPDFDIANPEKYFEYAKKLVNEYRKKSGNMANQQGYVGRKINPILIDRMIDVNGDLVKFIEYIKANSCFKIEVRRKGKLMVYYKRCKVLELGLKSYNVDNKYYSVDKNKNITKIDPQIIVSNPNHYFEHIKLVVDNWLEIHPKDEFEVQQNLATINQKINQKYFVIDMEYNPSQSEIKKNDREKKNGYDLLAIERETGQIILFEVKKGLGALEGNAGIKSHIEDFQRNFIIGNNTEIFKNQLFVDIENILKDKFELGIISDLPIFKRETPKFWFVYVFDDKENKVDQEKKYDDIFNKETIDIKFHIQFYDTFFIDPTKSYEVS